MSLALQVDDLSVSYLQADGTRLSVLQNLAFMLPAGSSLGIHGPSGSGKTTLLHALAGLSLAAGSILWGTVRLDTLSEPERDAWRLRHAAFIFQEIHLFRGLSLLENVLFPLTMKQWRVTRTQQETGQELLKYFGISEKRQLSVLSRGELQRVATARALIGQPEVLFADEPTASLDAANAQLLSLKLKDYCQAHQVTLITVSHDMVLLREMEYQGRLERGKLCWEPPPEERG